MMQNLIVEYYLWIKAFHIIAVISWMAGMLYLPRLYVYHVHAVKGSDLSNTLKVMEKRLLRFIMNPAMIAVWILGLLMIWGNPELMHQGWMHGKFALVILLSGVHGMFSKWRKNFEADKNIKSEKFFRIWNEVPTAMMILIVIFAVAEPF